MIEVAKKHKHLMSETLTEKVPLYDIKLVQGEKNQLIVGHDTFTFKQCKCGFKQPINVERKLL